MQLSEREWLIVNNMVLSMEEATDHRALRESVLRSIRSLISYDLASFYLANADGTGQSLLRDPVGVGFPQQDMEWYAREKSYEAPLSWTNECPRNMIIRDSDAVSADDRSTSWYYKHIKDRFDAEYSLTLGLAHAGENVGLLTLLRTSDKNDFSEKDLRLARLLAEHISLAVYQHLRGRPEEGADVSLSDVIRKRIDDIAERKLLSAREKDVFLLLCAGESPHGICDALCISEPTFKKHATSIYRKCGIANRYDITPLVIPELTELRP